MADALRAQRPDELVRLAFLELMSPTLPAAGAERTAADCRQLSVLPMFLGTGGHVSKDSPLMMDSMGQAHLGMEFILHSAVGELPAWDAAMAGVALGLLAPEGPPGP